jgi:hypothetical protein
MRLYVSFKSQDLRRYVSALNRLATDTPKIADGMCRYGAIEYKTQVTEAIAMQNFVTRIPRLKKTYLDWKVAHGYTRQIGILEHDLLNNIIAYKVPGGWFGGVDPNARDAGGKNWSLRGQSNSVIKYATWLEEGNRMGEPDQQRPRRIFMPIARRYAKTDYPKQIDKAGQRIGSRWY